MLYALDLNNIQWKKRFHDSHYLKAISQHSFLYFSFCCIVTKQRGECLKMETRAVNADQTCPSHLFTGAALTQTRSEALPMKDGISRSSHPRRICC